MGIPSPFGQVVLFYLSESLKLDLAVLRTRAFGFKPNALKSRLLDQDAVIKKTGSLLFLFMR